MGKMILMNFDKVTKGASAPFSFHAHHDTTGGQIAEKIRQ
jgi:hypothetical protein